MLVIRDMRHPNYQARAIDWQKWRDTYEGGRIFIDRYLEKYSNREDNADFISRKKISYCPAFAKAAINDVKNSIYQRISDVTREGGSDTYQQAIKGLNGGVDLLGNTMDSFIGREILPDLLTMGEVGIYIDMPDITGVSILESAQARPYVYMYPVENILCWVCNDLEYTSLLLRDYTYEYDQETNFPIGWVCKYRYLWKEGGEVYAKIYDDKNPEGPVEVIKLGIKRIPFIKVQITNSLLSDIADYQIALLNLASSDIGYSLKSNFPFYVEQFDHKAVSPYILPVGGGDPDGTPGSQETEEAARNPEVTVGPATGRRYPIGAERPGFIHPSSEPLIASMAKQEQLKTEIRLILNLAISNLKPTKASAESKKIDDRSLESGLSYIGLELEFAERRIAELWEEYEGTKNFATINYPCEYTLRTDVERRTEAKEIIELREEIPSITYKKEVSKEAARILLGAKVPRETVEKIMREIGEAQYVASDPETIRSDVETGLLNLDLASEIRGYPPGTAEKAKADHADRLARIADSQSNNNNSSDPGARGISDKSPNPGQAGKAEKAKSKDTTIKDNTTNLVRGKGK